jgi:hypothetical protein
LIRLPVVVRSFLQRFIDEKPAHLGYAYYRIVRLSDRWKHRAKPLEDRVKRLRVRHGLTHWLTLEQTEAVAPMHPDDLEAARVILRYYGVPCL